MRLKGCNYLLSPTNIKWWVCFAVARMTPVASSRPTKSFRRATAFWRGRATHSTCHSDNSSQYIIITLILYKSFCVLRFHHGKTHKKFNLRKAEDDKTVLLDCDVSTDELEELVADIGKELEALDDEVLTVEEEYAGPIQAEIIDGEIQLSQGEKSPDV